MMDKITTINGILMTAQNDFTEHVENTTVHVTEQEKEKWNKAPVTDAAGNMSLSGNLKAKGGTFSNAINAAGGVNIPIIPGDDTDAVRKADLTKPLIPMLSSQQENGVGFYHKLGNAFTAGGVTTCVSEDFPFIMSEHRIIGGGDDNLYAWYPTTFVLELNTLFNYGQIDAMNESTSKFGVRANFGPCYKPWFAVFWVAWPPVTWPYRQNPIRRMNMVALWHRYGPAIPVVISCPGVDSRVHKDLAAYVITVIIYTLSMTVIKQQDSLYFARRTLIIKDANVCICFPRAATAP